MILTCLSKLEPELRDQTIALLGGHAYKRALWEWQFERIPDADRVKLIVARDQAGVVQGFNGSMPIRARIDGATIEAHWSCDFIVAEDARGHGIGTRMKDVLRRECGVLMASGISPVADHVHRAAGWGRGAVLPRYTRVRRIQRWQDVPRIVLQQGARWLGRLRPGEACAGVACEIVDARNLPDDAARLWEHVAGDYPNAIVRDEAYLTWRYARHPLMRYKAIIARREGVVRAVAFFWANDRKAMLVDFLGSRRDVSLACAVVRSFLGACAGSAILECSTTDLNLQRALASYGFINPRRRGTIFNVYPASLAGGNHAWFLMGGDSDGDMLAAARAGSELEVELWSEAQFMEARAEWTDLLARSSANRLFLSWEWLSSWWSTYARRHALEMYCLAARNSDGRLVGLAPLYIHRANVRGLGSRRLQFMGNIWRGAATMRTEYLEFIVDASCADQAVSTILDELETRTAWSDLVLTNLDVQSPTYRRLGEHGLNRDCYVRLVARHTGYGIDTSGPWDAYLRNLTGNQRRKLFLQRRRLAQSGEIGLEVFDAQRFEEFAERLDRLHELRWGRRFFVGDMRKFHERLLRTFGTAATCHSSILTVGGRDVSALYNVRVAGREYNLQGGFDERYSGGCSVALLHLGYAIEAAFQDRILGIDLLVGGGKRSDFKASIADVVRRSVTVHMLRRGVRQGIYRAFDRVKHLRARATKPAAAAQKVPS